MICQTAISNVVKCYSRNSGHCFANFTIPLLIVKIFKDFEDFCLALKSLFPKNLILKRCPLKLISSPWFKLTVPLVIDILSAHFVNYKNSKMLSIANRNKFKQITLTYLVRLKYKVV